MPNHVINKLHFDCSNEQREAILAAIQYDPDPEHEETTGVGTFDFNKIIPMPNSLNIVAGSETDSAIAIYLSAVNPKTTLAIGEDKLDPTDFSDLVARLNAEKWYSSYRTDMSPDDVQEACGSKSAEDMLALGRTAVTNMLEYGATTWYDWCINNWGTKWNSYDPDTDFPDGLSFSTAWSAPEPVIRALSERYPDVAITHEWADEDIGNNCGRRKYLGGECISEYFPESNCESIEFALAAWDDTPESCGMVKNADSTDYIYACSEDYELIELFDKPALYTAERLTTSDIPEGMYITFAGAMTIPAASLRWRKRSV